MQLKRKVLDILLMIVNCIVKLLPIKQNQITFVSLESKTLESDLLLIYQKLATNKKYTIQLVLTKFDKNNLWTNFKYMLNTFKQVYYINRSGLVIINDNNYVISKHKRVGVKVLQVWHATGAIKKFGNAIKREYPIANYDYVIANSEYWKEPYHEAFNIAPTNIKITGMPRVDHLLDEQYIHDTRKHLFTKYPMLKDKKIILYAPTFRGNVYKGFTSIDFDGKKLIETLGNEYVVLYKYHPLLKEVSIVEHTQLFNMNHEDTHDLFTISEYLISDYSSIIFDYSLLNKPMLFYVPDLQQYNDTLGCFVEDKILPGNKCTTIEELVAGIQKGDITGLKEFRDTFFLHQDGKNIDRVIALINEIIKGGNI